MSPDIIVTDEIGTEDDYNAINLALNSGVKTIASIHAGNIDNLKSKLSQRRFLFEKYIRLERNLNGLTYELYDSEFNLINGRRKRYCCI